MPAAAARQTSRFAEPDEDDDDHLLDYGEELFSGFIRSRVQQLSARTARRVSGPVTLSGSPCGRAVSSPATRPMTHADYLQLSPPPPPPTPERSPAEDEATCVHEAGHAVACLALGVELHGVAVEPTHRFNGECVNNGHVSHAGDSTYKSAIIALAGPTAERRFSFGSGVLAGSDAEIVAEANLSDRSMRLAQAEAERIVTERGPAIRKLANELLDKRHLTGDEVRHLLRPRVNERQWPALAAAGRKD